MGHHEMIGKGIEKILGQIRAGAPDSKILLISPIWLGEKVWQPGYDPEFSEKSVEVSKSLAEVYRGLPKEKILHSLMRLRMQNQVQQIRNIWILKIINCWQRPFIKRYWKLKAFSNEDAFFLYVGSVFDIGDISIKKAAVNAGNYNWFLKKTDIGCNG